MNNKKTNEIKNLFDAFVFIDFHPKFTPYGDGGINCLQVNIAKINPKTGKIDKNEDFNTQIEIWLEGGPWDNGEGQYLHDIDLGCGAETYEEAIIKFANLIKQKYGDYELFG